MKTRKLHFNAWIPALNLLIEGVAFNGEMLSMADESWRDIIEGKFYYDDDEGKVYKLDHLTNDDSSEALLTVLVGEDWIWIEDDHFELMVSTGAFYENDEKGREIIEGDIARYHNKVGVITYKPSEMRYVMRGEDGYELVFHLMQSHDLKYVGNIFSEPHLNKMPEPGGIDGGEIKDHVGYEKGRNGSDGNLE